MAYLDVREPFATTTVQPLFPRSFTGATPAEAIGFTDVEWEVILLARRDRLTSLAEPTRLSRLSAWLFGGGIARRLADPRLEALRRLAVQAWHHGYAVPNSAIHAFKGVGFNLDQLELMLASIAAGRSSRTGRASA